MKKLLLTLLIGCYALAHETDSVVLNNPRNTLITAIARNDYGTTLKALEQMPAMTQADKEEFLEIADQMIITAIIWHTNHHWHGEIGKDSLKAAGYWIATILSGMATAISAGMVVSILNGQYDLNLRNRTEKLQALQGTSACTVLLAILTGHLGYKTVQKIIDSWMKPSVRLENALRIRDAIFHYIVITPDLINNSQNAIAIGSVALQTSKAADYSAGAAYSTTVGTHALTAEDILNCQQISQMLEALKYNTIGYWSPGASMPEDIEQTKE